MKTVRLENTQFGHNKFWEISYDETLALWTTQEVVVRWGKIGNTSQGKTIEMARSAVGYRIDHKRRDGYKEATEMPTPEPDPKNHNQATKPPKPPKPPNPPKPPEGKVFISVLKRRTNVE